jgi:hypothetical protein
VKRKAGNSKKMPWQPWRYLGLRREAIYLLCVLPKFKEIKEMLPTARPSGWPSQCQSLPALSLSLLQSFYDSISYQYGARREYSRREKSKAAAAAAYTVALII